MTLEKIREPYDIIFIEIEQKFPETLDLCKEILESFPKRIGKKKKHIGHEDYMTHLELLYYKFCETSLVNE